MGAYSVVNASSAPRIQSRIVDDPRIESVLTKSAIFIEKLGIVFEEVTADRAVATIPVEGNMQPDGFLHGGATMTLIETVASFGAALAGGWPENVIVGQQQTCNFLSTARGGLVRGVGKPIHKGRSTQVWDVEVTSVETGKLIAAGRVTLAVRPRRSDAEGEGGAVASGTTEGSSSKGGDERDSGGASG